MTATDIRSLTDRQLDDARRDIGETKLRIRRQADLRPILVAMEEMGETWYYDRQGDLRCKPNWKPGFIEPHRTLIAKLRTLNENLEAINQETEDRRIPGRSRPQPVKARRAG